MRDPVQAIIDFNSHFDRDSLQRKLNVIVKSPFPFFRATFHLFAADMMGGPFHKFPICPSSGRIVADLHTENFGGFRAVSGDLVYDINDFDDTADGQPYEYDLRRLLTSIILGGTENKLRIGDAVNAAETTAREYFSALGKFAAAKKREDLAALHDPTVVRRLLDVAAEKPRDAFMKAQVESGKKGPFKFKVDTSFREVDNKVRAEAEKRFPFFLAHCAQSKAGAGYLFEDIVFRYAGKGSLGKNRYAILMRKSNGAAGDFGSLRLAEWKDSGNSPLTGGGATSKTRNREVFEAALAFQLNPKRLLGYVPFYEFPMQTRELGANDCRFSNDQYKVAAKLEQAARVFGGITARAHLLASLGQEGPRKFLARSGTTEDRVVQRLIAFATAYVSQVHEDFDELKKRQSEVALAWSKQVR